MLRPWTLCLASALLAPLPVAAQARHVSVSPLSTDTVAFVNVNVVPMDHEHVLWRRTVIVAGGVIAAIGSVDSVVVPASARRIDGGDRYYVMPGLSEMHAHIRYRSDFLLLLANGITTARNMRGEPRHLLWRDSVAAGTLLGPRFTTAGPILYGGKVNARTPDEARRLVDEEAAAGYDFIKVYDGLSADAFGAVVSEAAAKHIPFAGHVAGSVGVEGAIRAHQRSIEHGEQLIYHYFGSDLDDARIPGLARDIAAAHVFVTPTISYMDNFIDITENPAALLARPEMRYVNPETYAWWHTWPPGNTGLNLLQRTFEGKIIRGLRDAGVRIMSGTDFYIIGSVAGFSLPRELKALQDVGLSPYDVLLSTTRTPAEFLGDTLHRGTVAVGKDADLLVVDANPLTDVANVTRRVGVMLRGRWFPAGELQASLDSLAASFDSEQRLVDYILSNGGTAGAAFVRAGHQSSPMFHESTMNLLIGYYATKKRFDDALPLAKLSADVYAKSPNAELTLGDTYAGVGQADDAVQSYHRALALGAAAGEVAEKLKKLGRD